jgi:hypothetical protein
MMAVKLVVVLLHLVHYLLAVALVVDGVAVLMVMKLAVLAVHSQVQAV